MQDRHACRTCAARSILLPCGCGRSRTRAAALARANGFARVARCDHRRTCAPPPPIRHEVSQRIAGFCNPQSRPGFKMRRLPRVTLLAHVSRSARALRRFTIEPRRDSQMLPAGPWQLHMKSQVMAIFELDWLCPHQVRVRCGEQTFAEIWRVKSR